jgi:hypothetical protein
MCLIITIIILAFPHLLPALNGIAMACHSRHSNACGETRCTRSDHTFEGGHCALRILDQGTGAHHLNPISGGCLYGKDLKTGECRYVRHALQHHTLQYQQLPHLLDCASRVGGGWPRAYTQQSDVQDFTLNLACSKSRACFCNSSLSTVWHSHPRRSPHYSPASESPTLHPPAPFVPAAPSCPLLLIGIYSQAFRNR